MTAHNRRVHALSYISLIEVRGPVNGRDSAGRCALEYVWSAKMSGPSHLFLSALDFQGFLVSWWAIRVAMALRSCLVCVVLSALRRCCPVCVQYLRSVNLHGVNSTVPLSCSCAVPTVWTSVQALSNRVNQSYPPGRKH